MKNILSLLLKLKGFMVAKPIVAIAIGASVVVVPVAGVVTYNHIANENSQKEIVYEEETEDRKIDENETKKKELKEQLKKENSELSDEELDKLVEENLKKTEGEKEKEESIKVEKELEEVVKEEKKEEVVQNNNKEKKPTSQTPTTSETKPSTPTTSKPDPKPTTPTTPTPKPEPTPTPEPQPTPTPEPQPEHKSTKPSGIDWALSSEYFSAVANPNSNDPILPVDEWNATVDNLFLNGGSASQVVQALNSYRYNGQEVFSNYGQGIGVGAKRESLGANPTLDKVYAITSTVSQHSNYVYLKVYYDSNLGEYILFYVNGTCNVDPFVFG